jgi:two-component system, chemotaxis family, chemotaxis protein CheY
MQVMVVDDDVVSRLALIDLMSRAGFLDILEFSDGQPAWEYLQTSPTPVLCCCDVRMPNMSGIELLQLIRQDKILVDLPFILVTSGSERDIVKKAIILGVSSYIVKPFNRNSATEKLFDVFNKVGKKIAEKPDATILRLSIPNDKLISYYDAFRAQVDQLSTLVKDSPNTEYSDSIKEQFSAIRKGCLTLGLWHCSKQLDKLKKLDQDQDYIVKFLESVLSALKYQKSLM